MEDKFAKYIQLSYSLFFTFLGFIVSLLLLLLGLRLLFGLLDKIPWFVFLYMMFIIIVPGALFISVFLIYFKRTTKHRSKVVRRISFCVFGMALMAWIAFFILDMFRFFKTTSRDIGDYYSYNIFLLAGSVTVIFLVGILQALSTEKEKDWMEKWREKEIQ